MICNSEIIRLLYHSSLGSLGFSIHSLPCEPYPYLTYAFGRTFLVISINLHVQSITFHLTHINLVKLMVVTLFAMDTPKGDFFVNFCFHYINFTNDSKCPQQIIGNPFFN
jgi:hypothetical protein